ncbi:helix-turn-helix domain-containing protein [Pseudomonas sp. EL_65y_Pfl2_R96]|uniref:helix-turn-helix domain-containing protein n=1 Tax=Pseudomonas sp. EL_65y_Pfl2_R96 TaxID=3088699 RepID=UPI0030D8C18F
MTACNPLQVQAFNTADVAEQIRATPGWVQHYQQMSARHFAGRVRYLDLQGVEIYEEQMNNALFSRWLSGTLTRLAQTLDPPSKEALTQQLLEDCLYILDNACVCLDHASLQRRAEERKIMKRVAEWAADTPEETLNLLELSQLAGVSLRQLQQAFKAYTGMSPTHWLRLRRLNSARRELLSRTASNTMVAQVAMHWSFWHFGRFSSSYRALFQELPSQTLARKHSGPCRRSS